MWADSGFVDAASGETIFVWIPHPENLGHIPGSRPFRPFSQPGAFEYVMDSLETLLFEARKHGRRQ